MEDPFGWGQVSLVHLILCTVRPKPISQKVRKAGLQPIHRRAVAEARVIRDGKGSANLFKDLESFNGCQIVIQ